LNLMEGLARQLVRVAKARRHYEDIGPSGAFGLMMIDRALEMACVAAGSNDIVEMMRAHEDLKGISE